MTAPAAPAAHFRLRRDLAPVRCYGTNHRQCVPMRRGTCSGCGNLVAWQARRGRMLDVFLRGGVGATACWQPHDCTRHLEAQREMAAQLWVEQNPDLALRNTIRVQILTLLDVRDEVAERGGDLDGLDARVAVLREMIG